MSLPDLELDTMLDRRESFTLKEKHEFKHFDDASQCDNYIRNNPHMEFLHKCCSNTGIAFISKKINVKPILNDVPIPSTKGTCDICFNDDVSLYKTCNRCIQPYCRDCLCKILSKDCPYCRGKLKFTPVNLS